MNHAPLKSNYNYMVQKIVDWTEDILQHSFYAKLNQAPKVYTPLVELSAALLVICASQN